MGPAGSAGKPTERTTYVAFAAEGVRIYLALELWGQAARDDGRLSVLMPGYGMACFAFEKPLAEPVRANV